MDAKLIKSEADSSVQCLRSVIISNASKDSVGGQFFTVLAKIKHLHSADATNWFKLPINLATECFRCSAEDGIDCKCTGKYSSLGTMILLMTVANSIPSTNLTNKSIIVCHPKAIMLLKMLMQSSALNDEVKAIESDSSIAKPKSNTQNSNFELLRKISIHNFFPLLMDFWPQPKFTLNLHHRTLLSYCLGKLISSSGYSQALSEISHAGNDREALVELANLSELDRDCMRNCGKVDSKRETKDSIDNEKTTFNGLTIVNQDEEINLNSMEDRNCHVNVLILGAGLAGLGAATALNEACNFEKSSFLVLEAQSKAGGRVDTVELLDYAYDKSSAHSLKREIIDERIERNVVDSGAQWLHGKHNYLHKISEKFDLLTAEQSEEGLGAFLYENCIEIDPWTVKKIDFLIGELLTECEIFARQAKTKARSRDNPYPKSVENFLRERFDQYVDTIDGVNEKQTARDLFDWHLRFQIVDNSCMTMENVSAKYWGKYSFNGESCQAHYNFRKGFGNLINRLLEGIAERVCYEKEVIEVEINAKHDKSVSTSDTLPIISVKCTDGSVYTANQVIVTFSMGVLKANHAKMFRPPLPRHLRQAIEDAGFETINKIFIEFETAWWGELDGIQFVFKRDEQDANNHHWTRDMIGFDVMKPHDSHVLLGWVGAHGAIQMEQFSDKEIIEDCLRLLCKFTNLKVPTPIKYYCTRWRSNRFVRGAYSYISTKCDQNEHSFQNRLSRPLQLNEFFESSSKMAFDAIDDKDNSKETDENSQTSTDRIEVRSLDIQRQIFYSKTPMMSTTAAATSKTVLPKCRGCNEESDGDDGGSGSDKCDVKPVLLFAGEACHDQYYSTAHGAFLSGMEQAQKILEFYN